MNHLEKARDLLRMDGGVPSEWAAQLVQAHAMVVIAEELCELRRYFTDGVPAGVYYRETK